MSSIYLPGRGMVDLAARAVDSAVREYDERLMYHPSSPATGQPTVFMAMEAGADTGVQVDGKNVLAVLAFPMGGHPDPAEVIQKLMEKDSVRHGLKLLDNLHAENERIREEYRYRASEADEAAAESMEWYLRTTGQTSHKRVYF